MHLRLVSKVLSLLSAIVSLFMIPPLLWAVLDGSSDIRPFLLSITFGVAAALALFFYGKDADYDDLSIKDGFAVVALSWVAVSLVGAMPYWLHGTVPTFTDAFFESVSGFTTTGASVLSDIEAEPRGILFWRSLTHWLGGMGIIVLSLAILPFIGVGGMELFKAEVPGPSQEKMTPRIRQTALYLWGVYGLMTVVQSVLLMLGGMSLFEALVHTFGTVATGGFSNLNTSVGQYGSAYFDWVITIFMFLAGVNFVLHYQFLRGLSRGPSRGRGFGLFAKNEEFRLYAAIILFAVVTICAELLFKGVYASAGETLRYGAFQVVSVITTTGFATADYELWPSYSRMLLFLLMFAGGCAGSTGGGMKILRLLVLWRHMRTELQILLHPRTIVHVKVGGKAVQPHIIASVTSFFILYLAAFIGGVFVITFLGLDLLSALSGVAATLGNVGPALGSLGPMENYAAVPQAGKWVFSGLMLMGRLELYTVALLFLPETWRR